MRGAISDSSWGHFELCRVDFNFDLTPPRALSARDAPLKGEGEENSRPRGAEIFPLRCVGQQRIEIGAFALETRVPGAAQHDPGRA